MSAGVAEGIASCLFQRIAPDGLSNIKGQVYSVTYTEEDIVKEIGEPVDVFGVYG